MRYKTTILIWASLLVNEAHTLFEKSKEVQNWILFKYRPMSIDWNLRYLADEISPLLVALALLVYQKNRINDTTVKFLVAYGIVDLVLYFINYKDKEVYRYVYLFLIISWIIIYKYGTKRSRSANRQGTIIKLT